MQDANEARRRLRTRADRLIRLIDLDAPAIIVENEIKLVEQAIAWVRQTAQAANDV
jgi:DNA-directed RNA polymerase beta' subunit